MMRIMIAKEGRLGVAEESKVAFVNFGLILELYEAPTMFKELNLGENSTYETKKRSCEGFHTNNRNVLQLSLIKLHIHARAESN